MKIYFSKYLFGTYSVGDSVLGFGVQRRIKLDPYLQKPGSQRREKQINIDECSKCYIEANVLSVVSKCYGRCKYRLLWEFRGSYHS